MRTRRRFQLAALAGALILCGCAHQPPAEPVTAPELPPVERAPHETERPAAQPSEPQSAPRPGREPARGGGSARVEAGTEATASRYLAAAFSDLPAWKEDDHAAALNTFVLGCEALERREAWRAACAAARKVARASPAAARSFFEANFRPYKAAAADGTETGLITGYFEPLLQASRKPSSRFRYPLYAVPEDLLVVDLSEIHPDLKGQRLRGRLEGRKVVPYYTRAQIEGRQPPLNAKVLYWVDDPIDLFFLHVQGSGQLRLDSGERVRIGYGDQNGHPYRSIGRLLIDRGELAADKASMQAIKEWARQNPEKLPEVLQHNASYVFFRELPSHLPAPLGALGVPVSAGRTLAVDPRHVPLGAPVYLATTWPNSARPLNRLMAAQDTGSAIRGPMRGDYFWGYGEQAGVQAGRMRQAGRMWILLPLGVTPQSLLAR